MQNVGLVLAFWGAVTGTTAIVLNLITFLTERPRLKLAWLRGFVLMTRDSKGRLAEGETLYSRLMVTNLGRKTLRVNGAYGVAIDKTGALKLFLFADGLLDTSQNRVLSPEHPSTEYHAPDDEVPEGLVYLGVNDGFGKTHGLWLAPWYRRHALKRKLRKVGGSRTQAA